MPTPESLADRSADPAWVRNALLQLSERNPAAHDRLVADAELSDRFVAITGASRFLTRWLLTDSEAFDVLADPHHVVSIQGTDLTRGKNRELLRIATRDLTGIDGLPEIGKQLADLADRVVQAALEDAGTSGMAVIALGKHGAQELNYSSDIDVLFVGSANPQGVLERARHCFRVDVDLRPEGRDGPLIRTLDSYTAYWDRWAQPWEFQALLKARFVAGDAELGKHFVEEAAKRVWERGLGTEELRQVREMKARSEQLIAAKGLGAREIKRGPGGIRDVEFAIQLLQLVHGRHDAGIRAPATLTALAQLSEAGYVSADDSALLTDAYTFLRTVEHRLQLVEDQQVYSVPSTATARSHLARVLGYRNEGGKDALDAFEEELYKQRAVTRSIHERLFFRPLLEAFAGDGAAAPLSEKAAEERLVAFGFADAQRTRQALRELTAGLTRASRLMEQLLPLLLRWLSESPDPDLGLLGLRTLATGTHRRGLMVSTFRESPEAARRLCHVAGTSRLLITRLEHQPEMIDTLARNIDLRPHSFDELAAELATTLAWREPDERGSALLRFKNTHELRIALSDVLGLADGGPAIWLTGLGESTIGGALSSLQPALPIGIVALGRFGGREQSYASDLDVLIVHGGDDAQDAAAAEAFTQQLRTLIEGASPATRLYTLDLDLRPEGKQGPLARSLEGFRTYYERWASVWERQAMLRARPIAGDVDLLGRFMEIVDDFVWSTPLREDDEREIRRIKARMERERIPAGEDPGFHLKLGRGSLSDVEWTAQLLQLRHGIRDPQTLAALNELQGIDAISSDDASALRESWEFCDRVRNRWYLVKGSTGDALPVRPDELARLSHSLGMSPPDLRDNYRRVTRRARDVVERVFYGRT